MNLTPNFTLHEMEYSYTATRLGILNKIPPEGMPFCISILETVMQPLRDAVGPLYINSGYRSPQLNRKVGGSKRSQHVYGPYRGAACDFVHSDFSVQHIAKKIVELSLPFDQLILEFTESRSGGWCHVSIPRLGREPRGQILKIDRGQPVLVLQVSDFQGSE